MSRTAGVLLGLALGAAASLAEEPSPPHCCPAGWDCVSQPACNQSDGNAPVVIVMGRNVRRRGRRPPAAHRVPKNPGHHRTE